MSKKRLTFLVAGILFLIPVFSFFTSPHASAQTSTSFFVDSQFEIGNKEKENALLITNSQRARFYVEENYYNNLSNEDKSSFDESISVLGEQFDTKIYDRVRSIFGSEWTPGIDNDPRITIYFTDMPTDFNGYFREVDENTFSLVRNSNKREMLYINAKRIRDTQLPAIIAHEFQHLINYNEKKRVRNITEERWLNEGLSEYAATLAGFSDAGSYLQRRVGAFKNSPNTSLTFWENTPSDYGATSLFVHYLADVYGDALIFNITHSSFSGTRAITEALKIMGINKDFSQVYLEWTTALFLNQDIDDLGVYAYKNSQLNYLTLHIPARATFSVNEDEVIKTGIALEDFSAQWYRFKPASYDNENIKYLNLKFTTLDAADKFLVSVIVTDIAGNIKISSHKITNGESVLNILGFNYTVASVVIIPASHTSLTGFDDVNKRYRIFSLEASLSDEIKGIYDGDLIRARGKDEIFVVKEGTRRWIPSPQIFEAYGHFKWENVIEVEENILNAYAEFRTIRLAGDYRVYQVSKDGGIIQWLNMRAREFEARGYRWNAIYEINDREFSLYIKGVTINIF